MLIALLTVACWLCAATWAQSATRLARVDSEGVLRWQDSGAEVALFGVNYYRPFWQNYPDLQAVGADHRQVIDQDVAHFARLGLDALRLHVFDREVSDRDGNLLDNEHLALLDYLILKAKERGIYTVLTPIAWWPTPGESPGYSTRFTMPEMVTDPAARGAQIATQFQYDPLPLAPFNQGWQTHDLNLVCTPQKAVSFLIAAEAFRRLPRLQDYGPYPASTRFGPFRVSYEEDLSELVTEREFFHSNATPTAPPAPDKLERVIGCGSSSVVRYEGTGAYFLEKLAEGTWRLEVYPDAVWVNDPHGAHSLSREVARVFWREWPMAIRLGDLGDDFTVEPLNEGNQIRGRATEGTCRIRPGVYLLRRSGVTSAEWKNAKLPNAVGLREFHALPGKAAPTLVRHEPVPGWVEGKPLPMSFTVASPQEPGEIVLEFLSAAREAPRRLPVPRQSAYRYAVSVPGQWLTPGQTDYRLAVRIAGTVEVFPTNAFGSESNTFWRVPVFPRAGPVTLFDADRHPANPQSTLTWKTPSLNRAVQGHFGIPP